MPSTPNSTLVSARREGFVGHLRKLTGMLDSLPSSINMGKSVLLSYGMIHP